MILQSQDNNLSSTLILENIVDNMPGHVYWKDVNGTYLGCNDQQAQTLGLPSGSEVVGKTDFELPWPEHSAEQFHENDQRIMRNGVAEAIEEKAKINGKNAIVFSIKAPIKDQNGEIHGILGISIDITAQKKAEKEKKRFLENATHDLRNPITGINIAAQTLQMQCKKNTDVARLLEKIISTTKAMSTTIDAVLEVSQQTEKSFKITTFSLRELILKIVQAVELHAHTKNIAIKIECPVDYLLASDYHRCYRILLNLAENAIKYTVKGHIIIRACHKSNHLTLEVEDTGIGIPKDKQKLIFERFKQLNAGEIKAGGAGIGLHVVQVFVNQIDGKISVKSKEGKGSIFSVSFNPAIISTSI